MSGRKSLTDIFAVAREPELSSVEKVVWMILRSYDSGKGAWPCDYTISGYMDKSERTIQRARRRLIDLGYLTQTHRGPKSPIYRPIVPGGEPYTRPPKDELREWLHQRSAKTAAKSHDK